MKKSKILLTIFLVGVVVLTGCGSKKTETPQEKTPEQKGIERVSNILDPGKISIETDGVYKMDMTVADFGFITHRQFHDFVVKQRDRGKFKVLNVYLDNGVLITVDTGNVLMYGIPINTPAKYRTTYFEYKPENGLYKHFKTNKVLEVNRNAAYPNYFE